MSDRWLPVSPVTGRLDAFQWKVPVAELESAEPAPMLIEAESARPPHQEQPRQEFPPAVASPPLNVAHETVTHVARNTAARPAPRVAPIIPLTQVPDDPGPEPEPAHEVEVETARPDAWQRIRQLFR